MFVGKASNQTQSGASEMYFTWVRSGLTFKHLTRLEKFDKDKHTNFLRTFISYGRKKPFNIGPWMVDKKASKMVAKGW